MPLARFSLYESGIEIYVASTADDGDAWQATLVHIALESRAFVIAPCHFQRASSYPDDFPLAALLEGRDVLGRGGCAILGPDGTYLAGPLYDEEGILYAELDPDLLRRARQRFDPAGHYHRPDVLQLNVRDCPCRRLQRPGYPAGASEQLSCGATRGIRDARSDRAGPSAGHERERRRPRVLLGARPRLTISAWIQPPARLSGSGSCSCERASRPPPARSSTPTGVESSPSRSR